MPWIHALDHVELERRVENAAMRHRVVATSQVLFSSGRPCPSGWQYYVCLRSMMDNAQAEEQS